MGSGRKRWGLLSALFAVLIALCAPMAAQAEEIEITNDVKVISTARTGETFNIGDGGALMISGQQASEPIVFEKCTFNLSGSTVRITGTQTDEAGNSVDYHNGEVATKLFISGNVRFDNCTFVTTEGAGKSTTAGWDAAIYFYDGDINLNGCKLTSKGYNGQFLGLYGSSGAVTFDGCDIATKGNVDGWSYAMYAGSVLNLKNSRMSATGMTRTGSNINAFYSGDLGTNYRSVNIDGSVVNFSDNQAGGFVLNNTTATVNSSTIIVENNLGNASNSGTWNVTDSTIKMNGNRGGHGLSCNSFTMAGSTLEVLHNGYAGVYINGNSSFTGCTVDIRCNGEKMLSYSAGDTWIGRNNTRYTLTIDNCTSEAQPGSAWLGAVGRKGSVVTTEGSSVVAYDLNSNAPDNLKSNTEPVLTGANVALSGNDNAHTLFLNPFMESDYARGNAENSASNNDADLFATDVLGNGIDPLPTFESDEAKVSYILGPDTAKIGTLTDAQLSHHIYDWNAGTVKYKATADTYGALAYPCVDVCADYVGHTTDHTWSFDCAGTYVYAPLVGLTFDANIEEDADPVVEGTMPEAQDQIAYEGTATEPAGPTRECSVDGKQWVFTGWYTDEACREPYDFNTTLTKNWTVVYAGWEMFDSPSASINATKVLNGATLEDGQFTFELVDAEGDVVATATNDAEGNVVFNTIVYDNVEATYVYTIREVKGDAAHMAYDDSVKNVEVTVKRNGGVLRATVEYENKDNTFTNTFTAPVTSEGFVAKKVLDGATLADGQFSFELRAGDDGKGEVLQTVKNDASGAVVFEGMEFSEAGTYYFTINEVNDGQDNVTYDDSVKVVYVDVVDDGKGTLTAEAWAEEELVFTNAYEAPEQPVTDPQEPADPQKPATDPQEPADPQKPATDPQKPATDDIPKTGDALPAAGILAGLAAAGAAIVAASRVVSRRNR